MRHQFADRWQSVERHFMEPLVGARLWHSRTTVGRLRGLLEAQGVPDGAKDELLELWRKDGRVDVRGDQVALVRRTWSWSDVRGLYMCRTEWRDRYVRRRRPGRMSDWCHRWVYPTMRRRS